MSNESSSLLGAARKAPFYGSMAGSNVTQKKTAASQAGNFLGKNIEPRAPSKKNKNHQQKPIESASSAAPFAFVMQRDDDFSQPTIWDRPSVEAAVKHYEQASQFAASHSDPSLANGYDNMASLLKKYLKSQDGLKEAVSHKRGDEAEYYRRAFFNYRHAIEALQANTTPASVKAAVLFQQTAALFFNAATAIGELIELTKPNDLTGPLTMTIREKNSEKITSHNLSAFSFEQAGAINSYYQLIASPEINSGSNLATIQKQKNLIEYIHRHLEKIQTLKKQFD